MHPDIAAALEGATGGGLTRDAVQGLASLLPEHRLDVYAAARLAASSGERRIFACGIVNAKSGRCLENCAFCAQSVYHDAQAPVYGLIGREALLDRAALLHKNGARRMGIVTGGGAPSKKDLELLCEAAGDIVERIPIALCASFGLLSKSQAVMLKEAGFSTYHHNLETSRSWFGRVCTSHAYDARLETVHNALAAGLRTCSGGVFGLGEGWKERLELSETLGALGVDSIPVNFLTPIKGTALQDEPALSPGEALDCVALLRLMHPQKDIVICGGRTHVLGQWDRALFFAGANGVMIGDYLTTPGGGLERDREMLGTLGWSGV